MTEVLYHTFDKCYDKPLEDLHRLPDRQLDAVNGGSPLAMFRVPKFEDPSILVSIVKDWLSNWATGRHVHLSIPGVPARPSPLVSHHSPLTARFRLHSLTAFTAVTKHRQCIDQRRPR